jgi:hypothetical protein
MHRWPAVIQETMWPFAIRHAVAFHNASIQKGAQHSPHYLFTGEDPPTQLHDFRVFGSPTYVLKKELQDGTKLNKWCERSWQGAYIGHSFCHSGSIPLIYNPQTTHILPQYHVIHDEFFQTVAASSSKTLDEHLDKLFPTSAHWEYKDQYSDEPYTFDTYWDPSLPPTASTEPASRKRKRRNPPPVANHVPTTDIAAQRVSNTGTANIPLSEPDVASRGSTAPGSPAHSAHEHDSRGSTAPVLQAHSANTILRGSTASQALPISAPDIPSDLLPYYWDTVSQQHTHSIDVPDPTPPPHKVTYMAHRADDAFTTYKRQRLIDDCVYILTSNCKFLAAPTLTEEIFSIFSASTNLRPNPPNLHALNICDNKADTLTQSQMLKDPDREQFVKSQAAEVKGLQKMEVFEVLPIYMKPAQAKPLSAIWSYRCKRSTVGTILKHKARLCVDGSQQLHARDFWETYATVFSWSTICLLLLLTSVLNLHSHQVDYTQAFPQAPLEDPVYMKMPQGWHADAAGNLLQHPDPSYFDTKHYIRLKRNFYGCHQAARNWFAYLTKGVLAHGFKQSLHEPCVYLWQDCIMIVYTNDCLIFAKNSSTIDTLIKSLNESYQLEVQGSVSDYLGIRIIKDPTTRQITMTQPGLIESVLQDLHLVPGSHTKDTPAMGILHPDRSGHPCEDKWNYHSVIGKLNYLAQNTRPDLSFAVHQCARYSTNPTALHEFAVKRIGRYLLLTRDKGLIMSPRQDFCLDMFIDANFASLWHKDYAELRECALSAQALLSHIVVAQSTGLPSSKMK